MVKRLFYGLNLIILPMVLLHPARVPAAQDDPMRNGLVNLEHLLFLTESATFDDLPVAIVHIYSEHPEYEWVDAAGEGISAVDDVARAALVYLWYYEQTGDEHALEQARLCLNFVLHVQNEDGTFHNFVLDRDGTINIDGATSYKSLGWWAMRSLWALAEGYRVFNEVDPDYAAELQTRYKLTESALAAANQPDNYGKYSQVHEFSIPAWIPNGAADESSVALLALTSYYRSDPNPDTQKLIEYIADGIAAYHLGDSQTYPFGMHPVTTNAPGYWHAWGSHQVHALAEAGATLNRQDWIDSAALEANTFLMRQLAFEQINEIGILPRRAAQIAYGTDMLVQGYMALYRATGNENYARYAGLAASWFFGNNMAGVPMYDPETGRCYDGIQGTTSWRVNLNSGAESTIEALMALLVVQPDPVASKYLFYTQTSVRPYLLLEAEYGYKTAGKPDFRTRDWTGESYFSSKQYYSLGAGDVLAVDFEVPYAGDYWIYAAHQREAINAKELQLVALHAPAPITVDGHLDEWADVPIFSANTARQFLRGASIWRGPDIDSFDVQFMWDDTNLYLAATVRDPVHEQDQIGPGVWQQDALWGYIDGMGRGSFLSSKFTLAQPPDGPQVWDWVASAWLPNAQLAWKPFESGGGYVYEAVLPLRSLGIDDPAVGKIVGIEIGRGIGGDSFLDLTGTDPDTASNLPDLILINTLSDLDALGGAESILAGGTDAIALGITLDTGEQIVLPSNTAPDRRYLWLDQVGSSPVSLEAGSHTLSLTYAGTEPSRRAVIDGFLIQPVVAQRIFTGPDGAALTLTYDTSTGVVTIAETE